MQIDREQLGAPFPKEVIKTCTTPSGTTLSYVVGHAIIQRLNNVIDDGQWSFEVLTHEIDESAGEVVVLGRLTVGNIIKTQFGSSRVSRDKDTGEPVSRGDDLKAAATDALKKCATLLGVGLYLYAGDAQVVGGHGISPTPNEHSKPSPVFSPKQRERISAKQHKYVLRLAQDQGLTRDQLNARCVEEHGVVLDHLSRKDASTLIEALMAGGGMHAGRAGGNGNSLNHNP